jgi:hypothetical protein
MRCEAMQRVAIAYLEAAVHQESEYAAAATRHATGQRAARKAGRHATHAPRDAPTAAPAARDSRLTSLASIANRSPPADAPSGPASDRVGLGHPDSAATR